MQATTLGSNRTGAALSPAALNAMEQAAAELTPEPVIDTSDLRAMKMALIGEAEAVGSVPLPQTVKGFVKTGVAKLKGGTPTVLMDKLGERLAFERSGTRLYDALIAKYQTLLVSGGADPLTSVPYPVDAGVILGETPMQTLMRIRSDEVAHFKILTAAIVQMGGDPTAQTPSADVTAVASMGIMQVLNDPRTTLAQCLNAMLTAELTDNAGWEMLIGLVTDAGESDLAQTFSAALEDEARHLAIVKTWLAALMSGTPNPAEAV